MAGRVAGKRCLVWGGGTGIGLACAQALAAEGAAVFLGGRRGDVLARAAAGLGAGHAAGDATDVADVQRVTDAATAAMGGLDTLVISAGAGGVTPTATTEPDAFQAIVDGNMRPVFLAVRYGVGPLIEAGAGSIVVISSMYGIVGQRERVAYCGAKAGVNGMVRAMALDLAPHCIRVNAICPGFVETDLSREVAAREPDPEAALEARRRMHPIPRGGVPAEMGALAVHLASDESAFTTGQAIAVDGGYTAR